MESKGRIFHRRKETRRHIEAMEGMNLLVSQASPMSSCGETSPEKVTIIVHGGLLETRLMQGSRKTRSMVRELDSCDAEVEACFTKGEK